MIPWFCSSANSHKGFLRLQLPQAMSLKHTLDVSKMRFAHLKIIKVLSFSFQIPALLFFEFYHHLEDDKHNNTQGSPAIPAPRCFRWNKWTCKSSILKKTHEGNGKWGGGKLQSQGSLLCCSFTKILQQFPAALLLPHLTILNVIQTGAHGTILVTKTQASLKLIFFKVISISEYFK